jgi:pimeloyl-ACP methyl ester carboxylesterase
MTDVRHVSLDGRSGFVEMSGAGPSVFCIHTAGQSGVQWRSTLSGLGAAGYRVIVPDLPGHGRSEPAVCGPVRDLGYYADWCIRVMDEMSLERPYVLGCSIGGKIALDIAGRISDRLSGVIAMAATAQPDGLLSAAALERGIEDGASPSRGDRTYYGTLAACGRSTPTDRAEMIATMHRREDHVVTTADLIGWFTHDVRDRLAGISCPTLLVVGDDDFWLDVDQVRWTGRQIAGARTVVLRGVGHYPMEEMDDFPALALAWLDELGGGRVPER